MLLWFVLGLGSSLIQTPSGQLLCQSYQSADRSAFFSAQFALSHLCWLVTYPLAGWLGSLTGMTITFAVSAIVVLAATGLAVWLWPAHDPDVLTYTHAATKHVHRHVHDEHHLHEHEGWEGPEPHSHLHEHKALQHVHRFIIDLHHPQWPA